MASRTGSENLNGNRSPASKSEIAKALEELARGEQTASALETRLAHVESSIENLLASVEENAGSGEQPREEQTPKENGSTGKQD